MKLIKLQLFTKVVLLGTNSATSAGRNWLACSPARLSSAAPYQPPVASRLGQLSYRGHVAEGGGSQGEGRGPRSPAAQTATASCRYHMARRDTDQVRRVASLTLFSHVLRVTYLNCVRVMWRELARHSFVVFSTMYTSMLSFVPHVYHMRHSHNPIAMSCGTSRGVATHFWLGGRISAVSFGSDQWKDMCFYGTDKYVT